ncbi:hypothetical protein V8F06_007995 [Rhypophila decipiens]
MYRNVNALCATLAHILLAVQIRLTMPPWITFGFRTRAELPSLTNLSPTLTCSLPLNHFHWSCIMSVQCSRPMLEFKCYCDVTALSPC